MIWHVISDEELMVMLHRAHNGESPDMLYIEAYVNAKREEVDGECGD